MLERLKSGRRKYGMSRYLIREANKKVDRWLFDTTKESLVEAFEGLGITRGITLCVHASLSRLGYVKGGPDAVIDALIETVGPTGCIMMPSFSADGTMLRSIEHGEIFDVRSTPSRVGAIPEAFRQRDGVVRSLHPTNSVTALGAGADQLLMGHEDSPTPYGFETPYGRLAALDNAYVLMLNTHVHSLLHHIQERVSFPNLFLDAEREITFIDHNGLRRTMSTKVMRPRIPYFVAIPSPSGGEPDWAILHDFALIFPRWRERLVRQLGYRFEGYKVLYERRDRLIADGILVCRKFGRGEIALLNVVNFVRMIQPEFERSIERFRPYYSVEYIERKNLAYG